MQFGLMFFAGDSNAGTDRYGFLIRAAQLADAGGLAVVWTPERHFDRFGGAFPNPALTSAALATVTQRVALRAGSLISPIHDALRIAEEWAVVDNLSGGRVAISFGSGWNANDFVFAPERYECRREIMVEQIALVQRIWRGEAVTLRNGMGREVEIVIHPRPVQRALPTWITSSGNEATFVLAGKLGANVLTHLVGQRIDDLAVHIRQYRQARVAAGHVGQGTISLMLHTYLATDADAARRKAEEPLRTYLRSAIDLEVAAARGGGVVSGSRRGPTEVEVGVLDELLDFSTRRYLDAASLIGSIDNCRPLLQRLRAAGVDEIACLIDFGLGEEDVLDGVRRIIELAGTMT